MTLAAAILDFDGVILESVDIKTDAFRALFSSYPEKLSAIMDYHLANNGISRMIKIRRIFEDFIGLPFTPELESQVTVQFSTLVFERVVACPFVPGALEFLRRFSKDVPLYVASASPDEELQRIVDARGLRPFFAGVFGHPTSKRDVIRKVMETYRVQGPDLAFIGDAHEDMRSAHEHRVRFAGRRNKETFPEGTPVYDDLFGVADWFEQQRSN